MTIDHVREMRLTRVCVAFTLIATLLLGFRLIHDGAGAYGRGDTLAIIELAAFTASVLFLIYGNVVYQWCRLGYHQRMHRHRRAPREEIEQIFDGDAPSLAVLVPSYKEEPRVVLQTLLSAAFAEYPQKSVALLLDDPPTLGRAEESRRRDETRRMVAVLQNDFDAVREHYRTELAAFARRTTIDIAAEIDRLASLYTEASTWLTVLAQDALSESAPAVPSHADRFFGREVVERAAGSPLAVARELRRRIGGDDVVTRALLQRHYTRLAAMFDARFSVFERKQFVNLSHEPNKAMNLNTYIGLMGRSWTVVERADGRHLCEASGDGADLTIAAADYLITLDADSLLLPDYALRLVHWMEQPAHARVAIAQTPYSAVPGAPSELERIAGATTDLQYIVHQGFTAGSATFWVGANALIRRRALEEIKQWRTERGHPVPVYIQDRTLIEDTESSIDLVRAGWSLYNYPERLAYSATPPDFGSLLIQRRRWANGGLLILGTLLAYAWSAPKRLTLLREMVLRTHYLASLAGGSAATLLLFFYRFDDTFAIVWVPLSALPYFVLYARDLRQTGYRQRDVVRVYALNLVLLPVIVGGVLKSIQQGITGAKIPFGRTPKVATRSAIPPLYAAVQLMFPLLFLAAFVSDAILGRWSHAIYALVNGALFAYALVWLLGLPDTVADAVSRWRAPRPADTPVAVDAALAPPVWSSTRPVGITFDAATPPARPLRLAATDGQ